MSEEEFVRRSQAGDWDAFEMLLDRHRTALARTIYLVTRDRESVQDIMQEEILKYDLECVRSEITIVALS